MKKNKKKEALLYAAALLCVLAAVIFACLRHWNGNGKIENGTDKKLRVALITKSTESAFWKSVYAGAANAGTAYNMEIIMEGPDNEEDYQAQNEMIEKVVKEGVDAIIFSAVDYNANAQAVNDAAAKGVHIVIIDSDVNSTMVNCRIGTDNYNAGRMAGEAALADMEGEIKIGIVNFDKNSENGQKREQGFRDAVESSGEAAVIDTIHVLSTTEDAQEGTEEMLKRHPEINVIVTFNEWTSLGVGYAIQKMGLKDDVKVVAFDSNVVSVGMLETGEVDALIVQNPYAMGYLGAEAAYRMLNGHTLQSDTIFTDTTLVTRKNMFDEDCQRILFAFEKSNKN